MSRTNVAVGVGGASAQQADKVRFLFSCHLQSRRKLFAKGYRQSSGTVIASSGSSASRAGLNASAQLGPRVR